MGLSGSHILLLIIVLVVLFAAPGRIPGLFKGVAQGIREFKKGMRDDETDVTESVKREKLDEREDEHVTRTKQSEKDRV